MKDKSIISAVKKFSKGIMAGRGPEKMCFAVCYPLQGYLSFCGVETTLVEGHVMQGGFRMSHYWLQMEDGRIIDPTASQFLNPANEKAPDLYLEPLPEWYSLVPVSEFSIND